MNETLELSDQFWSLGFEKLMKTIEGLYKITSQYTFENKTLLNDCFE